MLVSHVAADLAGAGTAPEGPQLAAVWTSTVCRPAAYQLQLRDLCVLRASAVSLCFFAELLTADC